jgi:hypothetical protein
MIMDIREWTKWLQEWNDHPGQMARWRGAAETSLEYAAEAETEGAHARAERLRERAAGQLRNAALHERLEGNNLVGQYDFHFRSLEIEAAHEMLDRMEAVSVDVIFANPEADEHAEARLAILRQQAINWEYANEIRTAALNEVVRMVRLLRNDGVEVNLSALARLTGISRQTLHTHLKDLPRLEAEDNHPDATATRPTKRRSK